MTPEKLIRHLIDYAADNGYEVEYNHRGSVDGTEGSASYDLYIWPKEDDE